MQRRSLTGSLVILLLIGWLSPVSQGGKETPNWREAQYQKPMTVAQTQAFMKRLAEFVAGQHMRKDAQAAQKGMVYEYLDMRQRGQYDQFVQGEALDTMHDGAWLAAALVNACRASDEPLYRELLTRWQLPFYCQMLNHSDELFTAKFNHARPGKQKTWSEAKEWLLQEGEKGFVPYWWDDGGSVSLERRRDKNPLPDFPAYDYFVAHNQPNPKFLLHGYSLGSSNHLAQDLGVMLQQAWLLLRESSKEAEKKLTAEIAEAARNLHECRMRHHGHIPMCAAPAALANNDTQLMNHVPRQDTAAPWTPGNHYTQALYSYRPGQRYALPGFADDQQYHYYAGLAKHGGKLPRPLAFRLIYDAYTEPMLYRYYADAAPVPPGINRFDLHPYYVVNGRLTDYRSDKKGPGGQPRPIGSRMGPQNMIMCGLALQALKEYPGIWAERYNKDFASDVRVHLLDSASPRPRGKIHPQKESFVLQAVKLSLESTRQHLTIEGQAATPNLVIKLFSQPDGKGRCTTLTLGAGNARTAVNDRGEKLQFKADAKKSTLGRLFWFEIPYTVIRGQKEWLNGIEHGRYSIQIGKELRNFYLLSPESQVKEWLERELAGGLRIWEAIFDEKGYIPTSLGAGPSWDHFSDSGGYAHLISAAVQWILYQRGQKDWELQRVP